MLTPLREKSKSSDNSTLDTTGGNQRVMRYEEGATSPNIIGGSSANGIGAGLSGAAVLSGGTKTSANSVHSSLSVIAGGSGNEISPNADHSGIGSGEFNIVDTGNSHHSIIGGGENNHSTAPYSVIGGGGGAMDGGPSEAAFSAPSALTMHPSIGHARANRSLDVSHYYSNQALAPWATIGGGYQNVVTDTAGSILGGAYNLNYSTFGTVGGGSGNEVDVSSVGASVIGGSANYVWGPYSTIGGGYSNTIIDTGSTLAGGIQNDVFSNYSTLTGGLNNSILSPYSFLGGGEGNEIDVNSNYSTFGGGFSNRDTNALYAILGGGDTNLIQSNVSSVLTGGEHNVISTPFCKVGCPPARDNFLGGGDSNYIVGHGNQNVLAGGLRNYIGQQAEQAVIGGGFLNTAFSGGTVVAGGDSNEAFAVNSTVGGGTGDTTKGVNSVIPGGDHLIAQAYSQTVIGFYNLAAGSAYDTASSKGSDDPLVIVGNGNNIGGKTVRSNAFEVSYNGHTTVHDELGSAPVPPRPDPVVGGTYQDNVINAWGDVPGGSIASPVPITNSFGNVTVFTHTLGSGQYVIQIQPYDSKGDSVTLTAAAIQVTVEENNGEGCGYATCTRIAGNQFTVRTYNGVNPAAPGECKAADRDFFFTLVGR